MQLVFKLNGDLRNCLLPLECLTASTQIATVSHYGNVSLIEVPRIKHLDLDDNYYYIFIITINPLTVDTS